MIHVDPALVAAGPVPATAPVDAPATAPARAMIERQLQMLSRLAEIGMEIAEACGREAVAAAADAEGPTARDARLAFARVSRAVRMTIALQSRLLEDLADLDRADARAATERKIDHSMRRSRLVYQAATAGVLARRGGRELEDEALVEEVEQLASEALERLNDFEEGDLFGRSFDQIVANVCKDLGLSPEVAARFTAAVAPLAPPPDPTPPPPSPVPLDERGTRPAAPQRAPP